MRLHRDTFASFVVTWIIILLLALILLTGKPISPAPIAPAVTNIYKKYYVVPPEPAEVPPVVIEGDYSTWTIYDTWGDDDHSGGEWGDGALWNKIETKILIILALVADTSIVKQYDIASKTLTPLLVNVTTRELWTEQSTYGTYTAFIYATTIPANDDRVTILKNAQVQQTLTDTDLGITTGGNIVGVFVSPTGKYVLVSGFITALGKWGFVLLVGSE